MDPYSPATARTICNVYLNSAEEIKYITDFILDATKHLPCQMVGDVLSRPSLAVRALFVDETMMFLRLKASRIMTFREDKRGGQVIGAKKKVGCVRTQQFSYELEEPIRQG